MWGPPEMPERTLVSQCAPTLAGLKTASLFCLRGPGLCSALQDEADLNAALNPKGVFVRVLQACDSRFLFYVYRPARLLRDLASRRARRLLLSEGYPAAALAAAQAAARSAAQDPARAGARSAAQDFAQAAGPARDRGALPDRSGDDILLPLLQRLEERLAGTKQCGFPHEIGLFLGYPPRDVEAFIANRGQHCLLCGTWKVYHDPDGARRCFDRYRRCTRIYCDRLQAGFSVERLTVAS